ncbi:peptide chain release factor N(5)-glutamine methyltransferase [Marivita sp. S2033]|uniref:peptide chain release factor N(5)-glutamine methyltransferase n=1 Tax=Marivita sp. S2033 TaxID=3373187 RepID=UPI003981EC92
MSHDPDATLRDMRRKLELAGSPSPARDASALMDVVQGDAPPWTPLDDTQIARLNQLVQRRVQREPISHITGKRAFWMHEFAVTADVLDPRPDTETLIETALTGPFTSVLDLGTGSGCIVLSLLHERPQARGLGTDLSDAALTVARKNAGIVGVTERVSWQRSDWFSDVTGIFDLIVSNPPYIALDEMSSLAPELSHEPQMALTDGADGLSAYRTIARDAPRFLAPNGRLLVEIGPSQAAAVSGLFERNGLQEIAIHRDLDGRDRVVSGIKSP